MSKRTGKEIYYWLWFEALRLSDEYQEVCKWVENSSEPEEKLDWSQHPHVRETYLRMGDVLSRPFYNWWRQRKPLDDVVKEIFTRMKVRPLDLCEIISGGLDLFKDGFANDFDSAKDSLLAWTKERYQQPEDLTIIIDTGLVENAKDVQATIKSLIVQHRGKNKPSKRFRAGDIGLYLNFYRDKMGLQLITEDGWPISDPNYLKNLKGYAKKDSEDSIDDTRYIENSDCSRMIRKAEKIINNATRGQFPGEY